MKSFLSRVFVLSACLMAVGPGVAQAQFFQPPVIQADGNHGLGAAGDFNEDGKTDIVVHRSQAPQAPAWEVRINDGNGNFVTFSVLGTFVATLPTVADVDGDRHLDVLLRIGTVVRVFWGNGDGTFSTSTDVASNTPSSMAVGDLNGDGRPDLAMSYRSSGNGLTIWYGLGGRQFDTPRAIADLSWASQVAVANIDGDSMPDLFVLVMPLVPSTPSLRVLRGANGLVWQPVDSLTLGAAQSLAMSAADLDGDGLTEAVIVGSGFGITIVAYQAGVPVSQPLSGVAPATIPPAVTDVDGDGRLDLLVAGATGTTAAVLLAHSDGTFGATPAFPISSTPPRWTLFGDVNGDGAVDVIGGGAPTATGWEIAVTQHVDPLKIAATGGSVVAATNGLGSVVVEATANSGHADVTFSWYGVNGPLGNGNRLTLSLPVGVHTLTVWGSTPNGLKATATAVVTVTAPPASEVTLQAIQTTVDTKLDVAVSSRASQESLAQTQNALMALSALMQTQLDVPISSRASAADVSTIGNKVDQLQSLLPSTASLNAISEAVSALGASLGTAQTRLAIEQALARGERIASFYLPTAQGGQLDLVRSIVIDVANKNEAAGGSALTIAKARRSIAEGDARKAAGDYRTAYLLYSAAYQVLGA